MAMQRLAPLSGDYYADPYYSDDDRNGNSSDEGEEAEYDDVQKIMAKVAGVEPRSCRRNRNKRARQEGQKTQNNKSSTKMTEFDVDMEADLDGLFNQHKTNVLGNESCFTIESNKHTVKLDKRDDDTLLDEMDVDPALGLGDKPNDSDEEYVGKKDGDDDDPLYDPLEDQANQDWVDKHRRKDQKRGEGEKLEGSDAVLNCPACMALLCRDCQRHSIFKTQYRAMFVQNCHINKEEKLYMPSGPAKQGRKRKTDTASGLKKNETVPSEQIPANCSPDDLFSPVLCSVCRTQVGVHDIDEVYHFFNVLSSYT